MGGTTTKLVTGLLVIIVGLVLLPVLSTSLNTVTEENRFICRGDITGGDEYDVYCTQDGNTRVTSAPFAGATAFTIPATPVFTADSESSPALTGGGLRFTYNANRQAAALSAAQSGPVIWAPSVGSNTVALLDILPLVFTVGLVVFGVYQFVSVARERMA